MEKTQASDIEGKKFSFAFEIGKQTFVCYASTKKNIEKIKKTITEQKAKILEKFSKPAYSSVFIREENFLIVIVHEADFSSQNSVPKNGENSPSITMLD